MIYDCILFYNELDILDLRLHTLNNSVDKFVIVESTVTFTGNNKKLYFENSKQLFKKYSDKIIHVIVDDTPSNFTDLPDGEIYNYIKNSTGWNRATEPQWGREIFQRECIKRALINCLDDDVIIISDCDEIPKLNSSINTNEVNALIQNMFYYHINMLGSTDWSGSKMLTYNKVKNNSINDIRQGKLTTHIVYDGGWHLTYMGGVDRIINKLSAYSHTEFNNDVVKNNIKTNIDNNNDILFRSTKMIDVNLYDYYSVEMIDFVKQKYSYLIR